MSVLTKALVVFVALAAVALSVLVAANVQNQQSVQGRIDEITGDKAAAKGEAKLALDRANAAEAMYQNAKSKEAENLRRLTERVNELTRQLTDATVKLEAQQTVNQSHSSEVSRLTSSNAQLASSIDSLQSELNTGREAILKAEGNRIGLEAANLRQSTEIELLERRMAQMKQMVDQINGQKIDFENKWNQVPKEVQLLITGSDQAKSAVIPAPKIMGKVTAVTELNGVTWLEIDLGTKDKIASQMRFRVHRGDRFLGNLVVSTVNDAASAGRVELKQDVIAVGDTVSGG